MIGGLEGVRIIEMGGPPGAFGTALLGDHGADVIRIARPAAGASVGASVGLNKGSPMDRNRRAIAVDMTHPAAAEAVLKLVEKADVMIEGFRPGVTERMGIGPAHCLARNPKLIYARMTGWGQEGPWANRAGHDVNYTAISGTLSSIGHTDGPPVMPVNYLGDWAGGLLLAFGIVVALRAAEREGVGQIVDAAMLDSAALLASVQHAGVNKGTWIEKRASNLSDGGWPHYSIYETADHQHVAVGALEPKFFYEMMKRLGFASDEIPDPNDQSRWPALRQMLKDRLATKSRDEWVEIMGDADTCFTPILSMTEALSHPHNVARQTFVDYDGTMAPAPAPRLSRTPARYRPWSECAVDTATTLAGWDLSPSEIEVLLNGGAMKDVV